MIINKHFKISIIKSVIRMLGAVIACVLAAISKLEIGIIVLGSSLFIAEGLGILEEVLDPRK